MSELNLQDILAQLKAVDAQLRAMIPTVTQLRSALPNPMAIRGGKATGRVMNYLNSLPIGTEFTREEYCIGAEVDRNRDATLYRFIESGYVQRAGFARYLLVRHVDAVPTQQERARQWVKSLKPGTKVDRKMLGEAINSRSEGTDMYILKVLVKEKLLERIGKGQYKATNRKKK